MTRFFFTRCFFCDEGVSFCDGGAFFFHGGAFFLTRLFLFLLTRVFFSFDEGFLFLLTRVDSCSREVLHDCFGRPFSLDPELAEIIASERWEKDSSFPEVPSHFLSSHSWKKGGVFFLTWVSFFLTTVFFFF